MEAIVKRAAGLLQVSATPTGIREIACRGRTPRVGLRLLRRARDFAQVRSEGVITEDTAREALALMDIDDLGLDADRRVGPHHPRLPRRTGGAGDDRRVPQRGIRHHHGCGRALSAPARLPRTHARGRVATRKAYEHLGEPYPEHAEQPGLFNEQGGH